MLTGLYDFARGLNARRKQVARGRDDVILSSVRRIERVHPLRDRRVVAMTFDDGPCSKDFMGKGVGLTANILDILKSYGAHATFDVIGTTEGLYPDKAGSLGSPTFGGTKYDHYPCFGEDSLGGVVNNHDLVLRIIQEGHELSNHSWSHRLYGKKQVIYRHRVPMKTGDDVFYDLNHLHVYLQEHYNYTMRLGRPPHYVDKFVGGGDIYDTYRMMEYQYLSASYDGGGWEPGTSYKEEVARMTEPLRDLLQENPDALNGQIIFQKDGCNMNKRTPVEDALPIHLELLKQAGYEVVTVSELLRLSPFVDLSPDSIVMPDVQDLLSRGHIVGYRSNTFHGERILTLDELLLMFATHAEIAINGDLGTYTSFKQRLYSADGNTLIDLAQSEGVEIDERIYKDKEGITRTDAVGLIAEIVRKREPDLE